MRSACLPVRTSRMAASEDCLELRPNVKYLTIKDV